jgi:transposase, IS30 family
MERSPGRGARDRSGAFHPVPRTRLEKPNGTGSEGHRPSFSVDRSKLFLERGRFQAIEATPWAVVASREVSVKGRVVRAVKRTLIDFRLRTGKMHQRHLTTLERRELLRRAFAGDEYRELAKDFDYTLVSVRRVLARTGGIRRRLRPRSARSLSRAERDEILRGLAAGESYRAIARSLGRAASTILREVKRHGGRGQYRAWYADERAVRSLERPKVGKLARSPWLCAEVAELLGDRWSPQQIAAILRREHPDDPEMQVSHETIYRSLFVQTRGELRRELTRYLRTARIRRHPHSRAPTEDRFGDMVTIRERPAEVEDRAVPGHWEGDLLVGKDGRSAIGTLVERRTRFVMLVKLGRRRTAEDVRKALSERILTLPEHLRHSLTWDRGNEMAQHAKLTLDTKVKVYFCDPHSPWQRGSNENTNGLLRQYFPKGMALGRLTQEQLDSVAASLNGRPRQTLEWMTPSQAFAQAVATAA